jgi:phage tail-like protein
MSELQTVAGFAGQALSWMTSPAVSMSHHFTVLIDNMSYNLGGWSRAAGLSVSWKQLEHREGDQGNYVHYVPGATTYEPITLSRAATAASSVVQSWLRRTSRNPQPQSGTIQLVDFAGIPIVQWRLQELFPIGWSIESFDAVGAKPAVETLKLAHTGFLQDDLSLGSLPVPPMA